MLPTKIKTTVNDDDQWIKAGNTKSQDVELTSMLIKSNYFIVNDCFSTKINYSYIKN